MEEKLIYTIMQNKEIYNAIAKSKSYEEFMQFSGNKQVNGYKRATLKEKRFKKSLISLVDRFS